MRTKIGGHFFQIINIQKFVKLNSNIWNCNNVLFRIGFSSQGSHLKIFEISSIGLPGNVAVKLEGTR